MTFFGKFITPEDYHLLAIDCGGRRNKRVAASQCSLPADAFDAALVFSAQVLIG